MILIFKKNFLEGYVYQRKDATGHFQLTTSEVVIIYQVSFMSSTQQSRSKKKHYLTRSFLSAGSITSTSWVTLWHACRAKLHSFFLAIL